MIDVTHKGMAATQATDATLVEQGMKLIHRDLLSGALKPSAKLRVQELVQRYGIGATPIREALSRLSPLGLVEPIGNRGFRAKPLSRQDLEDIIVARRITEVGALRIAMECGNADWEAEIVAALYRLKAASQQDRTDARLSDVEFDRTHKAFHLTLIAACESARLMELSSTLYDQAYRYRQIMMHSARWAKDFYDEHARLADKVLARDVPAACEHLASHLGKTLAAVYPDTA